MHVIFRIVRHIEIHHAGQFVDIQSARLEDEGPGLVEDGEVGEAEEVDLQEAKGGDGVHRELGHEDLAALVAASRPLQRHDLGVRLLGDNDAGGVRAYMASHSLELLG
jgi:hypothetical protein